MISAPRSLHQQLTMFDDPLIGHGHVRNVVGEFTEELTAALSGGRRHKTQGNCDYCPDVSLDLGDGPIYLESKAAGLSRQTFIYSGRVEKDRFFAAGNRLWYVVWHHKAETKKAATVGQLRGLILANIRDVYLVPFVAVDSIIRGLIVEPLNSAYGGTDRKMYGSGFRIPLASLAPYRLATFPAGIELVESLAHVPARLILGAAL